LSPISDGDFSFLKVQKHFFISGKVPYRIIFTDLGKHFENNADNSLKIF